MQSHRQRQLTAQATQARSTMLVLHDFDAFQEELLTVKAECGEIRNVCKSNMNSTPARRVTPP